MNKRILLVHHGKGLGGALVALLGLIDELRRENDIHVLCIFDSEAIGFLEKKGIVVLRPKQIFFYKYFYKIFTHTSAQYFNLFREVFKFYKFVVCLLNKVVFAKKEYSNLIEYYDIVYLNSTFISDWAYIPFKAGKKVIIHVREPLNDKVKGLYYKFIRNNLDKYSSKVIAISIDNANRVDLLEKTSIIYDPVVLERKNDINELNFDIVIDKQLKYFVYLGGNSRIKGFEQFVKSIKYLNDDIRIFYLGGFDDKMSIKLLLKSFFDVYIFKSIYLFRKIKFNSKVIVIGKSKDVFLFYRNSLATISCFSKPHASLPVIESFSIGKPVIVSNVLGMDELVVGRYNGFFFENGDYKALANIINTVSCKSERELKDLSVNCVETYDRIRKYSQNINEIVRNI